MIDGGLSSRTVRYTHSVLRSAMRQAIRWRLLAQDQTDGAQLPRLGRREMRVLTTEQSRTFLQAAMRTPLRFSLRLCPHYRGHCRANIWACAGMTLIGIAGRWPLFERS